MLLKREKEEKKSRRFVVDERGCLFAVVLKLPLARKQGHVLFVVCCSSAASADH